MPVEKIKTDNENSTPSRIRRIQSKKAKKKRWYSDIAFRLIVAIVAMFLCFVSLTVAVAVTLPNNINISTAQENESVYREGKIGKPVMSGQSEFVVHQVAYLHGYDYVDNNDNVFIAADVEITNKGSRADDIYLNIWLIKDDQHRQYGQDYIASGLPGLGVMGGTIAPGDSMRGIVAFEVPKSKYYDIIYNDPTRKRIKWTVVTE